MWKCHFRGQGSDSRVIPIGPLLSLKSGYVTVRYTNFRDCHYRTVIVIIYALTVRSYNELIKHLGIVGIVILRANNYTSIITSNNSTTINWGALTFNMFMSSAINGIPIAGVKALHHNMAFYQSAAHYSKYHQYHRKCKKVSAELLSVLCKS